MTKKVERRDFIKSAGAIALSGGIPSAHGIPELRLGQPWISNRVVSHDVADIEGGKEDRAVIEIIGSNGVKQVNEVLRQNTGFHRTTTIRTQTFASASDTTPAYTSIRTVFAEVRPGDDGKTEVSITSADENGIRPKRVIHVKSSNKRSYEGLSDQEIVDKVFAEKGLL